MISSKTGPKLYTLKYKIMNTFYINSRRVYDLMIEILWKL